MSVGPALLGQLRGDRDDYVLRPFAVDELAARIRLRLRLGLPVEETVLRQGEIVVDTEYNEVTVDGQPVSLSPTEFSLLMALLAAPGQVVAAGPAGPRRLVRAGVGEPGAGLHLLPAAQDRRRSGSGPSAARDTSWRREPAWSGRSS